VGRGPPRDYRPPESATHVSAVDMIASTVMVPFRMLKLKVELLNIVAILPEVRIQWSRSAESSAQSVLENKSFDNDDDGDGMDGSEVKEEEEGRKEDRIGEGEGDVDEDGNVGDMSDDFIDDDIDDDYNGDDDGNGQVGDGDGDGDGGGMMEAEEGEDNQDAPDDVEQVDVLLEDAMEEGAEGAVGEVKPEGADGCDGDGDGDGMESTNKSHEEVNDVASDAPVEEEEGDGVEHGEDEEQEEVEDYVYTTSDFVQSVQEATSYEDMLFLIDKLEHSLGPETLPFYKGEVICPLSECAADVAMRLYTLDRALRYEDLQLNLTMHTVGYRPRTQYTPRCVIAPECSRPLAHSGKCEMNCSLHDSRFQEIVPNAATNYPSYDQSSSSAYIPQGMFRMQAAPVLSLDAIQPYIPRPDEITNEAWI
jgi:hypothetical protein